VSLRREQDTVTEHHYCRSGEDVGLGVDLRGLQRI